MIINNLNFPEGPAFDLNGNLWCVEQHGGAITMIDIATSSIIKRIHVGGKPNGIAIDRLGSVWFCDSGNNSIRMHDSISGHTKTKVSSINSEPLNMPNDLAFDNKSNLLFSCPGPSLSNPEGYLCVMDKEQRVSKIAEGYYYPNGLAFSSDYSQLFFAETGTKKIWVGSWNAQEKQLKNVRFFAATGGTIGPDGLAFDEDGFLYVAIYGSGCVKVFAPNGECCEIVKTKGSNPTNVAFDPLKRTGLVVTEAQTGSIQSYPSSKTGIIHPIL